MVLPNFDAKCLEPMSSESDRESGFWHCTWRYSGRCQASRYVLARDWLEALLLIQDELDLSGHISELHIRRPSREERR